MKIVVFILIFFILGSLIIINNNDLNIYDKEDLKEFSDIFFSWFGGVYQNVQEITGNAVKLKWVPE